MPDSLRGQFLIAGKNLKDPNFLQSVVLIVEHGEGGAMGVVVNRPSGVTVTQALEKHFDLPESGEMVYVGGPVERNALFILHNSEGLDGSETPVVDGLYVGSSPDTFETVVRQATAGDADLKFRVYFGCAGWGPEQLEGELARHDWLVSPATLESVFHPEPYDIWERLVHEWNQNNPPLPGVRGNHELN